MAKVLQLLLPLGGGGVRGRRLPAPSRLAACSFVFRSLGQAPAQVGGRQERPGLALDCGERRIRRRPEFPAATGCPRTPRL